MPVKKSIRAKKSTRTKTSSRLSKFTRLTTRQIGARSMGLAMICIITAGMLISSHQLSKPADDANVGTQADNAAIEADATTVSLATAPRTRANADKAYAPAVVSAAKEPAAKEPTATEPAATEPAATLAAVTITGCLERADETTFRLKDTVGEDAPKSRSWKSGFLKKGSTSIEVVDAAHQLKLSDHVGQKVSLTGTLVDREMQVRSLQRVSTSCENSPKVRV
jgi:hypothetical protein